MCFLRQQQLCFHVASVRILTCPCLILSVSLLGLSHIVQALLYSGASLNLIHEALVRALGLKVGSCTPVHVSIADGKQLAHVNQAVIHKFMIAGVQHEETFLITSLSSHQMILEMP